MQNRGGVGAIMVNFPRKPICLLPVSYVFARRRGREDGPVGFSARLPGWVAREEAVDESDLIANK